MTVSATPYKESYAGNGVTTVFPVPFYFLADTDLVVSDVNDTTGVITPLSLTTDYTVSGALTPTGGAVNLVVATATGHHLTIERSLVEDQPTHFVDGDPLPASGLEQALDRIVMLYQQAKTALDRAAKFAVGSPSSSDLPEPQEGYVLGWVSGKLKNLSAATAQLAADLLSSAVGKGAALVAYLAPYTGAVATTQQAVNGRSVSIQDFLTDAQRADTKTANPVLDLSSAFSTAISSLSDGDRLIINGLCRITSPLVITKRISLWCPSAKDGIVLAVGAAADGVTYSGTATGINGMEIDLNVYGQAASCQNAVVLSRVDRSVIKLNVLAGASAYGVKVSGCLINRLYIQQSTNYAPPLTSATGPLDCVLVEKNTTYSVATNANEFYLLLEAGRHGVVATAQPGEGNNSYTGAIEGLTGRPFNVTQQTSPWIKNIHMEANGASCVLTACVMPKIGPAVTNVGGADPAIDLVGCSSPVVDGYYYGSIRLDGNTWAAQTGQYLGANSASLVNITGEGYGYCSESVQALQNISTSASMSGGLGRVACENIFPNPFMDLVDSSVASGCPGVTLSSATQELSYLAPYSAPGMFDFYRTFTTTVAGATNGPHFYIPKQMGSSTIQWRSYWKYAHYISICMLVYVATGQPDVTVYGNGTALATVTTRDAWVFVRASYYLAANTEIDVYCVVNNSGTPATGTFRCGGLSICPGHIPPKFPISSGARENYIVGSVASSPAFMGQRAYVSGTGKWYFAKDVSAPTDWIILN